MAHFAERCWHTVTIPWDRSLAAGGIADLQRLAPATREAYLELAATVVVTLREPAPAPVKSEEDDPAGRPPAPQARTCA